MLYSLGGVRSESFPQQRVFADEEDPDAANKRQLLHRGRNR